MSKTGVAPKRSCKDDHDSNSLAVDEALSRIMAAVRPVSESEVVPILSALGRVLAEDVRSNINVPYSTNSAMDGYAVNAIDLPSTGTRKLNMIGTAWAGKPFKQQVANGQCVRIMTGAAMPQGTDTVIIQEQADREGDVLHIGASHRRGQNVRQAGEDIAVNQVILSAGIRIMPATLGLLASLGSGEVRVKRRVRVAYFSTGDELRSVGEQLDEGTIFDSNRYTLYSMLTRLGTDALDLGVVRDRHQDIRKALLDAVDKADVVITTGGVSVGEADLVKEILDVLGKVSFWNVAIKPGRPLAFGKIKNKNFFGLPGNPVSVMVTFYQFVQPALRRMAGERETKPLTIKVPCLSKLRKKPGRVEYQRGRLEPDDKGRLVVRKTGPQGSGILRSVAEANCFIVLPSECGSVEPKTLVDVQPFFGLV